MNNITRPLGQALRMLDLGATNTPLPSKRIQIIDTVRITVLRSFDTTFQRLPGELLYESWGVII